MIIGDAAYKFNPISGHGRNSAIEDAAILADQLHALYSNKAKSHMSEDFAKAFKET
ncbi:hypothetical protein C7974DRAFT_411914 [Boeremia exigua]|uniref:uncharacterized protein n=1 Tax=Boeremia exigua TaxID=749465 RepID=UPI001E8DB6F8|nr:uncharacterized protein C7974DRAFT_411914 [Boeremia exigua]KAH6638508.1 hypothetical protein C7974DRAFT_411914 [Boeremia exigua]